MDYDNYKCRLLLTELIEAYGQPAHTSWLDPSCSIFFHKYEEVHVPIFISPLTQFGAVGYAVHAPYAVVFGEPLCPSNETLLFELTEAFLEHCRENKLKPLFTGCSLAFKHFMLSVSPNWGAIGHLKEGIVKDMSSDKISSRNCQHAANAGVQIFEYIRDISIEKEVRTIDGFGPTPMHYANFEYEVTLLARRWKNARTGIQTHLNELTPFATKAKWLYAVIPPSNGYAPQLLGLVTLAHLTSQNGYFVEYNLVDPDAPIGTAEALLQRAVALLKEEKQTLSLGLVPVTQLGVTETRLGPPKSNMMSRIYSKMYNSQQFPGKLTFSKKVGVAEERDLYAVMRRKEFSKRMITTLSISMNVTYSTCDAKPLVLPTEAPNSPPTRRHITKQKRLEDKQHLQEHKEQILKHLRLSRQQEQHLQPATPIPILPPRRKYHHPIGAPAFKCASVLPHTALPLVH